jgi:hypothetical protein
MGSAPLNEACLDWRSVKATYPMLDNSDVSRGIRR